MGKVRSRTELRFSEIEPPQTDDETLQRLLDAAHCAVGTVVCSVLNQTRAKKGEPPITEAQEREIVLRWANV